MAERLNRSEF